jgi:bacillopeptidase F
MRRGYSRLASAEEKRNIRRAVTFGVLTVAAFLALFLFGLPTVAKFAAFLSDIRKTSQPIEKNDTTPPSPPRIDTLPDATASVKLDVKGKAEAGSTVILTFNGEEQEVVVGNDGDFVFSLSLDDGENKLLFMAKDSAGNESQATQTYKVIFDDEDPKLEISSPSDGAEFFGSSERQATIQGTTDPEITLTINERPIKIDDNGGFTYATTLNEGDNTFNIKAVDKAGNTTEKSLTLKFSP